jgi:hypothetical protein
MGSLVHAGDFPASPIIVELADAAGRLFEYVVLRERHAEHMEQNESIDAVMADEDEVEGFVL